MSCYSDMVSTKKTLPRKRQKASMSQKEWTKHAAGAKHVTCKNTHDIEQITSAGKNMKIGK